MEMPVWLLFAHGAISVLIGWVVSLHGGNAAQCWLLYWIGVIIGRAVARATR